MSGHSKWSSIKHKKAKADAAKGKIFSKLVKEITVAAREGGGDPEANSRLRLALDTAKAHNMPSNNIERAVKRGTGELEGVSYEEIIYEAYGPGGIAILIEVLTDNKNRAAADIRHILTKYGGHLGTRNSVAYKFTRIGQITIDSSKTTEDEVFEVALEAGVEDVVTEDNLIIVTTASTNVFDVKKVFDDLDIEVESAGVTKKPDSKSFLSDRDAEKAIQLLEALEENDDVQDVHSNFDMMEE